MGAEGDSSETINIASEEVSVNIRCSNGTKFTVKTTLDSNVGTFKSLVAQNCDVPAEQQRLIYKGRILKDDQTLESYGLQSDHTIHMVRGFAASPSTAPATTNSVASDTTPTATPIVAPTESGGLGGAGLGASLFPGLGLGGLGGTGAPGLLGAGLPDFEQMQQQLTQNPNMMREIMNMPAIQSLMNNPDIMRNLIMSNPQMREIIDRNPELGHILNDPSILRQTLETARNPELMREMMRNTDRAMSNIESSPEGFNMLRRMYENVQEPFLNATTMAGADAGNNMGSNPLAALLGNQGAIGGQHRDGSNPSTTGSESASPNTNPLPNPWNAGGGTQTNSAPRVNPSGDTRPPPLGGLGSLPELDRMLGGLPDASMMTQMMQNPAISQMMQSMLSNPQYMNQMLNMNPQLRALTDSNPQIREMLQNSDVLRQLASPEMMQQMLTLQQSLLSGMNRPQANQDQSPNAGAAGNANNLGLDMLMNMFGGLGAGGLTTPENSNVPPEELYATQLTQLQEMGFFDTAENIRALQATRGNVHAAVERLLGNMGQ
ncbi:ubiquitin domain-containing protein DSK2b-like [Amaranthus tricolor]|uniref:ubiquitin domain-containing protein DSK2b-like n=1 Tax=Amaranthus tricolor TaxID=29722 RepID=UPI0025904E49|nr:ubiquitin domain-containing protein DSK2b-like [Amaranthus tricolor]